MVLTINQPVTKYNRSQVNKFPLKNSNFHSKCIQIKKTGVKCYQQKQYNVYESLLGVCAGQLMFTGIAQAASTVVDVQQTNSLPYILLFGALLTAGTLNGLLSVVKTATDKSSEKELLEKALNRHQNFVGQSQEQQQSQYVDENGNVLQKWQKLNKAEKRSQSAHAMTAKFQQGIGKSGVVFQEQQQSKQQLKVQKDNLGRAYSVPTEISKPVVYAIWNEDREAAAHVLQAQMLKNFGKSIIASWGQKISEEAQTEATRAYAVETKPSDMRVKTVWDEDRTLSAHVLQTQFSKNFGKIITASWKSSSAEEVQEQMMRAYAEQTKASEPVSNETHYQFITYRRIFFYDQSQTQSQQTQLVTMDEQQVSSLAQIAATLGEEIREILSEDRSVAAHVMQSEFSGMFGKVGFASYSQEKLQQNEKVCRAYAVDTELSQLVTLQQLTKEQARLQHQQNQAKNPLVQLFLAIVNFFKWLFSLIFGGGNNSGKPATA